MPIVKRIEKEWNKICTYIIIYLYYNYLFIFKIKNKFKIVQMALNG